MNPIPIMPILEFIAGICLFYAGYSIDQKNRKPDRCLDIETFFIISGALAMMDGGIKMISILNS